MNESLSAIGLPADELAAPSASGMVGLTELRLLRQSAPLLLSRAPLEDVLTELMKLIAAAAGALGVAIVFLEPTGKLVPGPSLRLPAEYLRASAGGEVGFGACGQAIAFGLPVAMADIRTDPRITSVRDQALQLGIVAVVAAPMVASDGTSLGALALHLGRPHTAEDLERSNVYAGLAAVILEHRRAAASGQGRAADEVSVHDREQYLAMVSHDLRNPLSAILMAATLLERGAAGEGPERTRKQIDVIIRSVRHMDRLITDLLDLAQLESGQFRLRRQRVDVKSLVREAVEGIQAQAHKKRLVIDVDVAPELTTLCCDGERLLQVLGNLLGNAVKFTLEGGRVRVDAALKHGMAEFTVADSGIGIPADQLARIFDRYWQAQRRARQGIGLGLSIASGIVEAHGGRIRVESAAGVGTTFSFTLPLHSVDRGFPLAQALAEFYDLPITTAEGLLEHREHAQAWRPGPTPDIALISVTPGPRYRGAEGFLVCIAAGATYPMHVHSGGEHLLILEGGLRDDDGSELWEGERAIHAAGTAHASTAIGEGACVLAALVMPRAASG
jgi:signal transduction histidine kinase/quercetin dioxygenase-like cupin family protein